MNTENILLAFILCFCAAVFAAIGCWAAVRRAPMHFWAGTRVPPAALRDIPCYNRACARLWWGYGAAWALAGICALFSAGAAGILTLLIAFGGLPVLIFLYGRIYKKYKR